MSKRDVITFRMDESYRQRLEKEARDKSVTVSAHIRAILIAHAERTELRAIYKVLRRLADRVEKLEGEIKAFHDDFKDAVR